MDVDIKKQVEAPLLGRQRVTGVVNFEGATPSILKLKEVLATKLKVNKDLVAIRHVYQKFGFAQVKVIAHVYKKRENLLRLEKLKKAERKQIEAEKKAAEEAKKAAKAE
jgi:ribosomal protein S24E